MSFFVGAILNSAVQTAVSSAGTILYYSAAGVWWAGKRLIYGREPTIQEQQALILEQQAQLLEKMKSLEDHKKDED